ncbi:hypothetical protein [Exiguobacterium sp. s189]|uniref:hypothetical protein n=1 Tax=Exiguobacterium sp. s189 TaxID=2751263 RepID=UPI001BE64857|nr:hypothetical protein [Exiguobacterium sp. s189]
MGRKVVVYITLIFLIFIMPIIIHTLMLFGNATTDNDWIGFFGSYIGGIIGAVVALWIVNVQVKSAKKGIEEQIDFQKKLNDSKEIIEQRVYVDYTMEINSIILNEMSPQNKYILLHSHVSTIIHNNINEDLGKMKAHFLKTRYYGGASCILDIKIEIELLESNNQDFNEEVKYTAKMSMSGLNRDETIYIPLFLKYEKLHLIFVKIEYSTLSGERIKFVSDLLNKTEEYYTITENDESVLIKKKELHDEYYIIPGNPHNNN